MFGAREQAEPHPPSATPNVSTEPDPRQPVASGNTPAAADIAAVAAFNASFDPLRDPASDLETAKVEAKRGGKRIMLDVGGEWCSWCHILDEFVEGDAEIRSFRDANFVWMKVNYSEDNENAAFLSQYPGNQGLPAPVRAGCRRQAAALAVHRRAGSKGQRATTARSSSTS